MKHHKISQEYFDNLNGIINEMGFKTINKRFNSDINLELINQDHKDFDFMCDKILNCGENFYNFKRDFFKDDIHIVKISSNNNYIGFLTFEDIDDFADYDYEVINVVTVFMENDYRRNHIITTILMGLILQNYENKLCMVISEPTPYMSGVLFNTAMNVLSTVNNGGITFNNKKEEFIDYLSMFGLMIKINYFNKQRFDSGNCRLVFDDNEYLKFELDRRLCNEDSININISAYMSGLDECRKNFIPPYTTNCLYYMMRKEGLIKD